MFRAPTDTYPDGLAYDPIRRTVWTTNETAGTETVIDAETGAVRATVPLGGEVGNVVYDSFLDQMVVAVQGRNDLAFIDPVSFAVTERIPTPGCDHPHGQALDLAKQVMFVGCEANATMVTVDLVNRNVIDHHGVGETPDVLAYDAGANRVYVAAESGWVSIFDQDHGHLTVHVNVDEFTCAHVGDEQAPPPDVQRGVIKPNPARSQCCLRHLPALLLSQPCGVAATIELVARGMITRVTS